MHDFTERLAEIFYRATRTNRRKYEVTIKVSRIKSNSKRRLHSSVRVFREGREHIPFTVVKVVYSRALIDSYTRSQLVLGNPILQGCCKVLVGLGLSRMSHYILNDYDHFTLYAIETDEVYRRLPPIEEWNDRR